MLPQIFLAIWFAHYRIQVLLKTRDRIFACSDKSKEVGINCKYLSPTDGMWRDSENNMEARLKPGFTSLKNGENPKYT